MKTFLKIIILGLALLALALPAPSPETTLVHTIKQDFTLSLPARQIASSSLVAPLENTEVYLSEEHSPGFDFTSVGGTWIQQTPNGTSVEAEVRFRYQDEWSEWLSLEEEPDAFEADRRTATAASDIADAIQYKFLLYGDGINSPAVSEPSWTFLKVAETAEAGPVAAPQFGASDKLINNYLSLSAGKPPTVISRKVWGADESYRYLPDDIDEPPLAELDEEFQEKFADELKVTRTIESDENGDKYKWPLEYAPVKKVIVHHTATTKNLDDPKQAIRDIYFFHTVSRGWGDIGYNYIIDKNGKIYEGRYGGESVIGAHAAGANTGSIGIAVLGDYEKNEVPEKVIASLSNLIANKARIHNFEPEGYSHFRGKARPNIFGHKDFSSTTCPGINLYSKLPIIRAAASAGAKPEKEKFAKDYDYIDHSDLYYVEMKPEESISVQVKLENIGTESWNDETFIVVNRDPAFDGVVEFPTRRGAELAPINESKVEPGEFATFDFKIRAQSSSDIVYMNVFPLMNGTKKGKDAIIIPVAVQQQDYKYEVVDTKFPGEQMKPGEEFTGFIKLKNTGNTIWKNFGENTIAIGTDHERDRSSRFLSPPGTRLATLSESEVAPGDTGTFEFTIVAPEKTGYYNEYFTPVIEGKTWLLDSGIHFETTVLSEDKYAASVVQKSGKDTWERGKSYTLTFKLRNLGTETWNQKNLELTFLREFALKISKAKMHEDEVEPGQLATFSLVVKPHDSKEIKNKVLQVKPKVDGKRVTDRNIKFSYKVSEKMQLSQEDFWEKNGIPKIASAPAPKEGDGAENDIRIKLSFGGDPIITGDGDYDIYAGDKKLTSLDEGFAASVSYIGSEYQVKARGKTYESSEPIRFVPIADTILQISNYENRPGWNLELNDNQFAGILEVRYDSDKLVVINELPLERYLKGLGEVSNGENPDKIKAIIVAARSYAAYYTEIDEKFPGKPYHLDDDPEVSQKYLGYGLEKRSPDISKAVDATRGQVITFNGEIVKAPYFNQSDGAKTKSAKEVWGWTHTPYLIAVNDTYCKGDKFLGHGVGMSGCGAKAMADSGFSYLDILHHYYTNIEVLDLY